MDFIDLSVYVVALRYTISSLSANSLRSLEDFPSTIAFTSCLVKPLVGAFSRASTVFARAVLTSKNPNLVNSS